MGIKALPGKQPKPTEAEIQKAILAWLDLVGIMAVRVNSGAISGIHNGRKRFVKFNSAPGCSDIIAAVPGQLFYDNREHAVFMAIECKRPGKAATQLQAGFLERVSRTGGIIVVATSVDDVKNALREAGCAL
jgi:hypothetical protein